MATVFWIIAALAIANAVRLIRNKANDKQARENYERHVADSSLRAGQRRANEQAWSRAE